MGLYNMYSRSLLHFSMKGSVTMGQEAKPEEIRIYHRLATPAMIVLLALIAFYGGYKHLAQPVTDNPAIVSTLRDARFAAQLEASRAKAARLRNAWNVWALKHKAELLAAKTASPRDAAAFDRLYRALPAKCSADTTGFTFQELSSGEVEFSWQPSTKDFTASGDSAQQTTYSAGNEHAITTMKKEFARYGDISICHSANPGPTQIALWASGKVTESSIGMVREGHVVAPSQRPEIEILPAFSEPR